MILGTGWSEQYALEVEIEPIPKGSLHVALGTSVPKSCPNQNLEVKMPSPHQQRSSSTSSLRTSHKGTNNEIKLSAKDTIELNHAPRRSPLPISHANLLWFCGRKMNRLLLVVVVGLVWAGEGARFVAVSGLPQTIAIEYCADASLDHHAGFPLELEFDEAKCPPLLSASAMVVLQGHEFAVRSCRVAPAVGSPAELQVVWDQCTRNVDAEGASAMALWFGTVLAPIAVLATVLDCASWRKLVRGKAA